MTYIIGFSYFCRFRLRRSGAAHAMGTNSRIGVRAYWHPNRIVVPVGHGRRSVECDALHVPACPIVGKQSQNAIGKRFQRWGKTTTQLPYETKWCAQLCPPFTHRADFNMHNDPDMLRDSGRRSVPQSSAMGRSGESVLLLHIIGHYRIRWSGSEG